MARRDVIEIKNAVFYAYHGATAPQIRQGQRFVVDAVVVQDMSRACADDMPDGILNHLELYGILEEVTTRRRFNLMQVLALEIINEIKRRHPEVKEITIGACKASCVMYNDCKNMPGGGGLIRDHIGVRLTRTY